MESAYPTRLNLAFSETAKLLVVEDNPDTLEMLKVYFSHHGYTVITARNGKEALEALDHEHDFDLVLLDLFIRDIGGMGVLTGINRRTDPPSVIVVTGLVDKEIAHDAVRLGAFDYILKPYSLPQVETSVVVCLAHREYVKQSWWKPIAPKPAS
jgi:two-component system KDP operon response regulator KdpE